MRVSKYKRKSQAKEREIPLVNEYCLIVGTKLNLMMDLRSKKEINFAAMFKDMLPLANTAVNSSFLTDQELAKLMATAEKARKKMAKFMAIKPTNSRKYRGQMKRFVDSFPFKNNSSIKKMKHSFTFYQILAVRQKIEDISDILEGLYTDNPF